jgi:hypothetical protein
MPEHVVGKRPRRERLADELLLIGRAGNKRAAPRSRSARPIHFRLMIANMTPWTAPSSPMAG